jgi:catecholate siderophore receptor
MRIILIRVSATAMADIDKNKPASVLPSRSTICLQITLAFATGVALPLHAEELDPPPLQRVTIVGTAERGYDVQASTTATKTETLLRDTPQAITVVTKELMRDQLMQGMADVIRYVPGIVTAQGEGNRDTAVFRGNSSTGDFFIDGIRDDVQYFRDLYNIDSVEALKGPNAMIFGRAGSGGVINRVTKQPTFTTQREVTATVGSWANRRVTADFGQPVSDNMALRLNAMAEDSNSYRNGAYVRRHGVNPTWAIKAGPDTKIVVGFEHFQDERTADRGVPGFEGRPLDVDPATFFGNQELSVSRARANAFNLHVTHEFANGVSLRNRTRYASYDKFYQNVFASTVVKTNAGVQVFDLGAYNNATQRDNLFNQTDLNFSFAALGMQHKIATGLELGRQETDNFRNTGYFSGKTTVPVSAPYTTGSVSFRQSTTDADNHGVATTESVYVQDLVELSPHWQAIAGLRYDRFDVDFTNHRNGQRLEVTDTPVSPRAGLVYKPIEAVSIYASYSRAFAPRAGDQLASLTPNNASLDPEKFTNIELGAKWDIRPSLSASAAVYRLDRTNVAVTDPADVTRQILVDGQRTRGVELGLQGALTRQWDVMGGYAYQDAKLTAAQSTTVKAGTIVPQVPKHTLSLWNRYDFTTKLGAGLGVVYRDSIYASTSNAVKLPAFTRVDGAMYYNISPMYRVQLNVENLFDRRYWASANSDSNITPGSPRAVRVTAFARF